VTYSRCTPLCKFVSDLQ